MLVWLGPTRRSMKRAFVGVNLLFQPVFIMFAVVMDHPYDRLMLAFAVVVFVSLFLAVLGLKRSYAPIWDSVFTRTDDRKAADMLEAALLDAGVGFERERGIDMPPVLGYGVAEAFHLNNGTTLVVLWADTFRVYVGPVREDNGTQVEESKVLVERALAPPHHHDGVE